MLAVVGENIIDLVPESPGGAGGSAAGADGLYRAHAGGSPANVAAAAARLGTPTALIARVSRDVFGTRIRERLAGDGVDGRYLVDATDPSSLAVVSFDAERRASYDFWLTGGADWQWRDGELPDPLSDEVTALHVGSLAAFLEPGATAIEQLVVREAHRGRVTLSLDPNVRPTIIADPGGSLDAARERVERLIGIVDVVKASDEDLGWLYPGVPADAAAAEWSERGPALVVVTQGPDGATAIARTATVAVPAPSIALADTVGAGDTFSGALLDGLERAKLLGPGGRDRIAALDAAELTALVTRAVTAAAINCTRPGANPPSLDELEAVLG